MRGHYDPTLDPAGYANCVLDSGDDYEPYGYAAQEPAHELATHLQLMSIDAPAPNPRFDRVIESQLLASSCMVGC